MKAYVFILITLVAMYENAVPSDLENLEKPGNFNFNSQGQVEGFIYWHGNCTYKFLVILLIIIIYAGCPILYILKIVKIYV